jgi:hypothetical protein
MTTRKKYKMNASKITSDASDIGAQSLNWAVNVSQEDVGMKKERFPIVGIGASAGGLADFETFFSSMPSDIDPNMAFVLVQHLAPDHKSILAELIRKCTHMPVFEVEDGMTVKPNCVYIISSNSEMAFSNGILQLLEPSAPRGQRLPIDFFFRSLAQDQHERAACIVFSGTGSDGTLGVRAVKGEGGYTDEDKEMLEALTPTVMEVVLRKHAKEALQQSEQRALTLVEELKKADRSKNEFISTLSHEIRNPLAVITAGISLLELTDDAEKVISAKEIMKRQSTQLCRLVDDLLDLTRITMNKINLKKERIELNKLVATVADDFKSQFDRKGVRLETDISTDSLFLEAERCAREEPSRSFRILFIEDNNDLADILCSLLKQSGHKAISA